MQHQHQHRKLLFPQPPVLLFRIQRCVGILSRQSVRVRSGGWHQTHREKWSIDPPAVAQYIFNASTVYECLTSVPFNPAVASRFIQYYNDTLQFQSTLAFLKDPPASYQQPATDLIAGLARIQQAIDNGQFKDQYSFEATLQTLIYSAHDAHLKLIAGVLAPFTFGLPFEVASISLDGKELPKVYVTCKLHQS